MRTCKKCYKEKDLIEFPKGRHTCKICHAKDKADWQRSYTGRKLHAISVLKYSKSKKGRVVKQKEYSKERTKGWDKFYIKYNGRAKNLQERYGITSEDYNKMLAQQKGVCDICGNPETTTRKSFSGIVRLLPLHVDHDHETGKVRGLLCNNCNNGLARFKDNIQLMANAIVYIEKHKKELVKIKDIG